jgi:hypothetical protein
MGNNCLGCSGPRVDAAHLEVWLWHVEVDDEFTATATSQW